MPGGKYPLQRLQPNQFVVSNVNEHKKEIKVKCFICVYGYCLPSMPPSSTQKNDERHGFIWIIEWFLFCIFRYCQYYMVREVQTDKTNDEDESKQKIECRTDGKTGERKRRKGEVWMWTSYGVGSGRVEWCTHSAWASEGTNTTNSLFETALSYQRKSWQRCIQH